MPSDYENAPATQLLATRCACCSRPLLDAASCESGVGPDCRQRYGYEYTCEPAARMRANFLIRDIAARQDDSPEVRQALAELAALGFHAIVSRIGERLHSVTLLLEGDRYVLDGPYSAAATSFLRSVPGGRWDATSKRRTFPRSSRAQLWEAIRLGYGGMLLVTEAACTTIPGLDRPITLRAA